MLLVVEELLVLLAHEDDGAGIHVPYRTLRYGLSGAVLLDLGLAGRIDTDSQALYLVDRAPLGDDLLDPILADIAAEADSLPCEVWLRRIARRADELHSRFSARLVRRGVLETDDGAGFVALSRRVARSRRYPGAAGEATSEIRSRLMEILFGDDIPTPRDAMVFSLARTCDVFRQIMTREEYDEVAERIDLLATLEPLGQFVARTIRETTVAESQEASRRIRERGGRWPRASERLPFVGHAHRLLGDLRAFLHRSYLEHGPVFEVTAPGRRFVAIAGAEANLFVNREGKHYLRSRELWDNFFRAMGSSKILTGLEGSDHRLLRRTKHYGYSGEFISKRIPEAVAVVDRELARLPADRPVPVFETVQRIMFEQIALLSAGISARDDFDSILLFNSEMHRVHLNGQIPRFATRLPRSRRARRDLERLIGRTMDAHDWERRAEGDRDLIDDLLRLHRTSPDFLPDTDLFINAMGPFLVGLDTVPSTTSFALHALLQRADLLDRARAEADALFAGGGPTAEGVREMTVIPNTLLETMRMFPVAEALHRTVANSFEFGGYRIPHGAELLIALAVPNYLPEFFPDPERFDIERYSPERREDARPGAFAPFGLGHHSCMGQAYARTQMAVTLATLLHRTHIAMEPKNYRLKIERAPTPRPSRGFRIGLRPRRG